MSINKIDIKVIEKSLNKLFSCRPPNNYTYIIALATLILLFLSVRYVYAASPAFNDIPESEPFYPYVKYLTVKNMITGYSDGTFRPTNPISRAEITVLLVKAGGLNIQRATKPTFKDVKPEHWAYEIIETAARNGIIKGYPDGFFRPESPVTRAETSTLLLGLTKESLPSSSLPDVVKDVGSTHWARHQITVALDAGLLTIAARNSFQPDSPATRAQVARGLAIMLNISPERINVPLTGTIVPIKGNVYIIKADKKSSITTETTIEAGITIRTNSGSKAELRFLDGSGIRLEENTELTIKVAKGQATILRNGLPGSVVDFLELDLPKGKIFGALATGYIFSQEQEKQQKQTIKTSEHSQATKSKGLLLALASSWPNDFILALDDSSAKKESLPWYKAAYTKKVRVKVDMPWGVAAIRGTFWMSEVDENHHVTNIMDGAAEITAANKKVVVEAGQSTLIKPRIPPTKPDKMTDDEQKSWAEARDWVEQRAHAIQQNAPVVTPSLPVDLQSLFGEHGILIELVLPPIPPVVDEVMKSLIQLTSVGTYTHTQGTSTDKTPPKVNSCIPGDGSGGIMLNQTFTITFSEKVRTTDNFNKIKLKTGDQDVKVDYSLKDNILTLRPVYNLSPNTSYILTIPAGAVEDNAGNKFEADYIITFITIREWQIEQVDNNENVGPDEDIALDSEGNTHISYYDDNLDCLKYGYRGPSGWQVEVVDSSGQVGEYTSIALDGSNNPHISYYDAGGGNLKYAYRDNLVWHVETVDSTGDVGKTTSIAADISGKPSIAYYDSTNKDLKYAIKLSDGWHCEIVDSEGDVGSPSLALDEAGNSHICYSDNYSLNYTFRDEAGWHNQTLVDSVQVGGDKSLAIDKLGNPHIGFFDFTNYQLIYMYKDINGWKSEIVDSDGSVGWCNSMALDSQGNPHFSYAVLLDYLLNADLKYAYKDGLGWHTETVDSESFVFFNTSIALDDKSNPHICYCDSQRNVLKYAYVGLDTIPPVVMGTNPSHGSEGVEINSTITINYNENIYPGTNFEAIILKTGDIPVPVSIDISGKSLTIVPREKLSPATAYVLTLPFGSVIDISGNTILEDKNLVFTTARNWYFETIDSYGDVGQDSSVAVDVYNNIHISYYDNTYHNLKYALKDKDGWHAETVDSDGFVGQSTSIDVDMKGNPHICYYDYSMGNVKYAWRDSLGWHIENVANPGDSGYDMAIALDSAGHPHISFRYCSNYNYTLKYAYKSELGWQVETVDSEGEPGDYLSIDMDSNGRPHLSYIEADNNVLKYAYKDNSGWHTETVPGSGEVFWFTSISVDDAGNPHIGYQGAMRGGLKYATRLDIGWHVETVDIAEFAGDFISIALDQSGYPHMIYLDYLEPFGDNPELKYAYKNSIGWHIETVDNSGYARWENSIALTKDGIPYISYYDSFHKDLQCAYYPNIEDVTPPAKNSSQPYEGSTGVALSKPIIITFNENIEKGSLYNQIKLNGISGTVPTSLKIDGSTLTLDPDGDLVPSSTFSITIPSGAVKDMSGNELDQDYTISFMTAKAWQIETVDSIGSVGSYSSIVTDVYGYPHISYYNSTENDLKYAYKGTSGWQVETVDSEGWVGEDTSIAIDPSGYPHISYRGGGDYIKHAWKDDTGWHTEEVVGTGKAAGNMYSSIDIDLLGNPHICYYDIRNDDLKYAVKVGPVWNIETVDSTGDVGSYTSLKLDILGRPHISYLDSSNSILKYVYKETVWQKESVDPERATYTSITLDSLSNPHISYIDDINDDLKYAYRDEMGWHIETVDSEGHVEGFYISIALDNSDNPYISYYDGDTYFPGEDNSLKIAFRDDSCWHSEIVDSGDYNGRYSSLAIDNFGIPHISYFDGDIYEYESNNNLKYATLLDKEGPVITETNPNNGITDVGLNQDIIITFNEKIFPGASYDAITLTVGERNILLNESIQGNTLNLTHAEALPSTSTCTVSIPAGAVNDEVGNGLNSGYVFTFITGKGWLIGTLDNVGDVGRYTSIAIDSSGNQHITYLDYTNYDLKYILRDVYGNHSIETVDSEGQVGEYTSIVVDWLGQPHISYLDETNKKLKYATRNGAYGWVSEIVDNLSGTGYYTSISLDQLGRPCISYYDAANRDLKYAVLNGTVWSIETVDSAGDVGSHTSMAVDPTGTQHISYYDATNNILKYAFKDNNVWYTETVEGAVGGYYTSLVLDSSGQPQISFYDAMNNNLKFVMKEGNNWEIETIDNSLYAGYYTSLVLDKYSKPHISYYDGHYYDLKHAYHNELGEWQIETVDSPGLVGSYTSIAVDNSGEIYIVYYDGSNMDLKYSILETNGL